VRKKTFYITTTLPYVNADPHIGTVLEFLQADAIARYHRMIGEDVIFNTGTDEHGVKIYRKAIENSQTPKQYCDDQVEKFKALKEILNLSYTNFIRTTDPIHVKAVQRFWEKCLENGDITKGKYKVKYCVGCELEKTDSELVNGRCPIHPNYDLEVIEEENYFFRFSKYQKKLLSLYEKKPDFVIPSKRYKEIVNFVKKGLKDFSISRVKEKMPWGIDVPNDPAHVIYVWFDALVNYISTIGWPEDIDKFEKYWPCVQIAGKDNLRQQSAMWQAMLLSAGLPTSKQIIIHGFITINGQKISKSLGNVIHPIQLVEKYGKDATRYYLLAKIPTLEDADFSFDQFETAYNDDLANGLGNFISRVTSMVEKFFKGKVPKVKSDPQKHPLKISQDFYSLRKAYKDYRTALEMYRIDKAISYIWRYIKSSEKYIEETKPWKLAKINKEKLSYVVYGLVDALYNIAWMIYPFLPETSQKIAECLKIDGLLKEYPIEEDKLPCIRDGTKITSPGILFPKG